jgi:hypothetical protein
MAGLLLFLGDASKATLAHSQALAGNGFVFSRGKTWKNKLPYFI